MFSCCKGVCPPWAAGSFRAGGGPSAVAYRYAEVHTTVAPTRNLGLSVAPNRATDRPADRTMEQELAMVLVRALVRRMSCAHKGSANRGKKHCEGGCGGTMMEV